MRLEDNRPADAMARERELVGLLHRLWTYAYTTRSDLSRMFADEVAEAASRGFITTEIVPGGGLYGRLWKLTPQGLAFLWNLAGLIEEEVEQNYVARHTAGE